MRSSLTNVPFADPEILDRQLSVGPARDARVTARDLAVIPKAAFGRRGRSGRSGGPRPSSGVPAVLTFDHPQLLVGHRHPTLRPCSCIDQPRSP